MVRVKAYASGKKGNEANRGDGLAKTCHFDRHYHEFGSCLGLEHAQSRPQYCFKDT